MIGCLVLLRGICLCGGGGRGGSSFICSFVDFSGRYFLVLFCVIWFWFILWSCGGGTSGLGV